MGHSVRQWVRILGRRVASTARMLVRPHRVEHLFPEETRLLLYRGYDVATELQIMHEFADPTLKPTPGFITDFIGVKTRTSSIWQAARHLNGTVQPIPIPSDYHAETIEWLGLLRSAKSAVHRGAYRALELGAGFGMWSVAGGVAARRKGLTDVKVYAVEGDELLGKLAEVHFADNGLDPAGVIKGAVGVENGTARWPKYKGDAAGATYNYRPIYNGERNYMGQASATVKVRVLALNDLLDREPFWDLVHFDIQGHEVDVCRSALAKLTQRAHRLVIGTHSRLIDGDLIRLFHAAPTWILENEKPARMRYEKGGPSIEAMTQLDGTQIWRNTALDERPSEDCRTRRLYGKPGLPSDFTGTARRKEEPSRIASDGRKGGQPRS